MKKMLCLLVLVGAVLLSGIAANSDFYVIGGGGAALGTKITSLPYPITKSGFYYVGGNLSSAASGIIVSANDVTIDLGGFTLTGNGGSTYGVGIGGQTNVEVRNGTVRGFQFGIWTDD